MGSATEVGTGIVERYLKCLTDHDWDGLATTIADQGLTREGPFCDLIEGKAHYLAYLRKVLTTLQGHRLEVRRVLEHNALVRDTLRAGRPGRGQAGVRIARRLRLELDRTLVVPTVENAEAAFFREL